MLARTFNQMTERLLHLYETSRDLSARTQVGAILAQARTAVQPVPPRTAGPTTTARSASSAMCGPRRSPPSWQAAAARPLGTSTRALAQTWSTDGGELGWDGDMVGH